MLFITRRERFSSAHRMFRPDWSDEQNQEIFGACSNPNWHGHNYELFVTVKGPMNPETGYAMNIKDLSTLIKRKVIIKVDHKNMNTEVDFMQGKIASTENMAVAIWEELAHEIETMGCTLHCVKIQETENNYVEYYG
ncbi:MAG: 6-carboxytetrahydropterin synthase [Bacteroidales bacterium]